MIKLYLKTFQARKESMVQTIEIQGKERSIKTNLTAPQLAFFKVKWEKKTKCPTLESFVYFLSLYGQNNIEARIGKAELPDSHILKIDAVSNSTLSRLKDELMGKSRKAIGRKGVFGNAFHERVLEPNSYEPTKYNLRPSEMKRLELMYQAIQKDSLTRKLLAKATGKEVVKTWIDVATNILCKGKLDLVLASFGEVADLKTTAAKSEAEFINTMELYDYDRQGAFYGGGVGAKRFRFIAVQKVEPFNVYHFVFDSNSEFLRRGKKKADFLLKKYKERQEV